MIPKLYKGGTGTAYVTSPGHVLMTDVDAHESSPGHVVVDYGIIAVETSPGHVVLQQVELESLRSLSDCIGCTVTQELNGEYELEMRYPVTGVLFDEIALRSVIYVKPDPTHGAQPFRVYRISKPLAGVVSIWARHISYDLSGIVVEPYSAPSLSTALAGFKAHSLSSMPYAFSTDKSIENTFTVAEPSSIWQLLGGQAGSILDVYAGEWEFDDYNCVLHSHRGSDRGVSIRYGKNMVDLEQDANCAAVYTGVYPFWRGGDNGEILVQLPERTLTAPGTYDFIRIMPLDMSEKFDEPPTEDALRNAANNYMTRNSIGVPDVSWAVSFVQLSQSVEYADLAIYDAVNLGDDVTVEFEALGVSASARAVSIVYNALLERYDTVTLGRVKSNLADTIVEHQKEIDNKPGPSIVEQISSALAKGILGATGGAVRLLDTDGDGSPDELYIADNPDPLQAVKVWRFNYNGWAASENGYSGPFIMGATLTDGLLAHAVTAANLTAGTIRSADGKTFVLDLDAGTLQIEALSNIEEYVQVGALGGGEYGVKIGQRTLTDAFKALFTATRLSFYDGTTEAGFFSNKKLNTPTIRTGNMELTDNINDPNDIDWRITLGNGFNIKWVGG